MQSVHKIFTCDSRELSKLDLNDVHLVVTSPPYPMIEMWDDIFIQMNPDINFSRPYEAFELMNKELDKVWEGIDKFLVDGGIVCINIGNATRSLNKQFGMYPSNVRITQKFMKMGYTVLPEIIWRKQSTAPNKFMGSGMLPPNAYVTQEHEYILIFRKGGRRENIDKSLRRSSAYFWNERNEWFSDLWKFGGARQSYAGEVRSRTAAYPFLLPYRLIQMFSIKGDTILDPFLGTGTTSLASLACGRSSVGLEISEELTKFSMDLLLNSMEELIAVQEKRIDAQKNAMKSRIESGKNVKYHNFNVDLSVVTTNETDLSLEILQNVKLIKKKNPITIIGSYLST